MPPRFLCRQVICHIVLEGGIPQTHLCLLFYPAEISVNTDFLCRFAASGCQGQYDVIDINLNVDKRRLYGSGLLYFQYGEHGVVIFVPISTVYFGLLFVDSVDESLLRNTKQFVYLKAAFIFCATYIDVFMGTCGACNDEECCKSGSIGWLYPACVKHDVIVVEIAVGGDGQVFCDDALETESFQFVDRHVN